MHFNFGQRETAILEALHYLDKNPLDGDVRLMLGQFYFMQKDYTKARRELIKVIEQTPTYLDAILILVNVDLQLGNYSQASFYVDYGLLFNPLNNDLIQKRQILTSFLEPLSQFHSKLAYQSQTIKLRTRENIVVKRSYENSPLQPKYIQLRNLYHSGKQSLAMNEALMYLRQFPNDGDVHLLLGQFYFYNQDYALARKELLKVLSQTPTYKDAILNLINLDLTTQRYSEALALVNIALLYNPFDPDYLKKKYDVEQSQIKNWAPFISIAAYQGAFDQKIITQVPKTAPLPLKPKLNEEFKNEIGLYQQNYYISDVRKVWDYTTLYYGRKGDAGRIYGKVNYNNRLGYQALQGEIEAVPQLNKYIYMDLVFAFSNQPTLFPNQLYGGEVYVTLPNLFDFSLGGKYNFVDSLHQFTAFTGSLAKQINQERITYRPIFYDPSSGKTSFLNLFDYRHFIKDPFVYCGITLGTGTSPDLANLTTVDFLVTKNQIISPYLNFTLFNDRLAINASFYYQHQVFDTITLVRNWTGGTLRFAWNY